MRLRRSTVEHPFATIKYRIFGHPRFLLRGKDGAQTEISLAAIAYNLKRMMKVLGGQNSLRRLFLIQGCCGRIRKGLPARKKRCSETGAPFITQSRSRDSQQSGRGGFFVARLRNESAL